MEMPSLIDSSFPYMLSIEWFHWGSPAKKRMPYEIKATQGGNRTKKGRTIVFVTLRDRQKWHSFQSKIKSELCIKGN